MADDKYIWGTGRRKNAVARVRICAGTGEVKINNRSVEEYFPRLMWQSQVYQSLKTAGVEGRVDVFVNASGGGLTGQAGATKMGIARALVKMNADLRPALKKEGLLSRDARMVERKKFGQKGARGKRQFSKREYFPPENNTPPKQMGGLFLCRTTWPQAEGVCSFLKVSSHHQQILCQQALQSELLQKKVSASRSRQQAQAVRSQVREPSPFRGQQ